MGLPALTAVAGSLFTKLEGIPSSRSSKAASSLAGASSSANDAASISDPGMLLTQLQNLSQQNPTEFKKITAQVAQHLQAASATSASSTSTGAFQSSLLSRMATNFQNASKTGNFSDLFPHSSHTASEQNSTATTSGHPHQQYADANGASVTSTVHSIFSQALSQIKTDIGSTAALKLSF